MSAPTSRPIHPCVTSLTQKGSQGAEFSTWAYLTHTRNHNNNSNNKNGDAPLPNLVTASGSTLHIYTPHPVNGKLRLEYSYPSLSGTVVFLATLPAKSEQEETDSLLIGFAGIARLVVVTIHMDQLEGTFHQEQQQQQSQEEKEQQEQEEEVVSSPLYARPDLLQAICLLDFSSVWKDHAHGATVSEDAMFTLLETGNHKRGVATVAVVLGGGVAVAVTELVAHLLPKCRHQHGWWASEPYILPLAALSSQLPHVRSALAATEATGTQSQHQNQPNQDSNAATSSGMFTNWGDILDSAFLSGYSTAETLLLLHSVAGGRTWTGRLARENTVGPPPLFLTALSVNVAHNRTALLWSLPMPQDAQSIQVIPNSSSKKKKGVRGGWKCECLVLGVNSIVSVQAGKIQQILAVNGWARATCPVVLADQLKPNPTGLKLSLQLDGSACCFFNENSGLIVLRRGQVYLLQRPHHTSATEQTRNHSPNAESQWSLLPTGHTLATLGEVTHLNAYPMTCATTSSGEDTTLSSFLNQQGHTKWEEDAKADLLFDREPEATESSPPKSFHVGLAFAGSRLGDSHMLGYAMDKMKVPVQTILPAMTSKDGLDDKIDSPKEEKEGGTAQLSSSAYEQILAVEEEALYAPVAPSSSLASATTPTLVQPSDEEDETELDDSGLISNRTHKRLRHSTKCSVLRFMTSLDRIINLGPVGQSCEGPLAAPPPFLRLSSSEESTNKEETNVFGASAYIFPCGFGSSGGLALATVPGRDDRTILSEQDCLNVQSVYSLPSNKLILLGMPQSYNPNKMSDEEEPTSFIKILHQDNTSDNENAWEELNEWTDSNDQVLQDILRSSILLNAGEIGEEGDFAMLLQSTKGTNDQEWRIAILRWDDTKKNKCNLLHHFLLDPTSPGDSLRSSTPFLPIQIGTEDLVGTACRWSSGRGVLVLFSKKGLKCAEDIPLGNGEKDEMEDDVVVENIVDVDEDQDTKDIRDFYASSDIVSLDLFLGPSNQFSGGARLDSNGGDENAKRERNSNAAVVYEFDEDELDLYGIKSTIESDPKESNQDSSQLEDKHAAKDDATYLAVVRKSGLLEVFQVSGSNGTLTPCWSCIGVDRGLPCLGRSNIPLPLPRSHKVHVNEIRFFSCGPTRSGAREDTSLFFRAFCLAVSTSNGDFFLYTAKDQPWSRLPFIMEREQVHSVCRVAKEQTRHRGKLIKKGIVPKNVAQPNDQYTHTSFFRFNNISGQDGLFAALAQPKWVLSERGKPTTLCHRSRYAAPAGAKLAPVTCFSSPLPGGGFLTLHERVGRYGSQRLTMFREISPIFEKPSLIPGGGICMERIAFGVTVRQIRFIPEEGGSSGDHPLYAILVSRDLEIDQSHLNDDGLTAEERAQAEREKEEARIQRQVEADLGGFDVEQEWVEEIARDDVFTIQNDLGGAPPTQKEFYSLWIVDAANEWRVVDSYDLEDWEQGLTLQVLTLSDFKEEPGSETSTMDLDDLSSTTFIGIGTGTVNHNGEDVSSKGRVLLFELKKPEAGRTLSTQVVSLSLSYEKDIFHGPVTTLACLVSEGKRRLVIGAGSDVNLEQWGNGRLTQVGFFRATMQILNILLFKNFFLLSDAYDSIYFLVWRESDKSLTLLAKDYDPIAVYAAGIMSRGAAMTFLCHDDRQNIQFFQYAPGESAARGGNKLVCQADFHLGSQTTAFQQHYCRSSLLVSSASSASTVAALKQQDSVSGRTDDEQRLGVHFGTTDGVIFSVVPLSEPVYWRLAALQSVLANAMESDCALSPRAWRLYSRSPRRGGCRSNDRKKGVIDGDLVFRFVHLPITDQEDLASAIGSTVELILDNLLELECNISIL